MALLVLWVPIPPILLQLSQRRWSHFGLPSGQCRQGPFIIPIALTTVPWTTSRDGQTSIGRSLRVSYTNPPKPPSRYITHQPSMLQ
ncbi:hypothetical protein C8Q76DRAFT_709792 [Earliella scabrosa]|nr:hypothetical protein C8Q76DRAFT_709792 [Earliella scabrosa]